jgi:uncharacterized protein (DUF1697 family)
MRHVCLLRGINVGPHQRIAMPALRELLTGLGYGDVVTYVQSGNVVLTSRVSAARLERDLEEQIAEGLGVRAPVVVRTRDELAAIAAANPFADTITDPKRLQVTFLSTEAPAGLADAVEAAAVAPEQVAVRGREVYAWHPDGIQRSKLAALLAGKRLGVTATARNWNTVTKLLELAEGYPPASTTS